MLITNARCDSTTDMFAAGFQDHDIGKIIAVRHNTGAGGANVWTMDLLRSLVHGDATLKQLPRGVDMRTAIRPTLRGGEHAAAA